GIQMGRHLGRAAPQQRLLLLELRDLLLVRAWVVVLALRGGRGGLLALLVLEQVGVFGAGLHLGAVVLLGQELRVGGRRLVVAVVHVDHLLVRLALGRRRWRHRWHRG